MVNGYLDRAKVVPKAVCDESKTLQFQIYEKFKGSSSIFGSQAAAATFNDSVKSISVEAVTLDEYFDKGTKLEFIKIDAEGAEPYILRGAKRILSENRDIKVLMEFAPPIIQNAFGNVGDFYSEILSLGFQVYRIQHDSTCTLARPQDLMEITHCDVLLRR